MMVLIVSSILLNFLESIASDWIITHFPHLAIVLAIVVFAIFITIKIVNLYHRFKKTEGDCSSLNTNHSSIKDDINAISTNFTTLVALLLSNKTLEVNPFKINSPIELNEIGEKILNEIGGKLYVDSSKDALILDMESKGFKSGLDVQDYARVLLLTKSVDDNFVNIKNFIFQNPIFKTEQGELSLDLSLCIQIMGIYLRNKYFEKHPNLKNDL